MGCVGVLLRVILVIFLMVVAYREGFRDGMTFTLSYIEHAMSAPDDSKGQELPVPDDNESNKA